MAQGPTCGRLSCVAIGDFASLTWVRDALRDALAVVFPVDCAGCGGSDRSLCDACRAALSEHGWRREVGGVPVFAALSYEDVVRRAILSFKEEGRTDVARALSGPLALLLVRVVASLTAAAGGSGPGGAVSLVTVPPSVEARRRRGFDPVRVLLSRAGLRPRRVLVRRRSAAVQKGLSVARREQNRVGTLAARHDLLGERFVLVDDVVTSGATAREVVRAVSEAGGEVVAVVALAATHRVDGRESSRWVRFSGRL